MIARGPVRTCVGCGQRAAQGALLRVAAGPDGLHPDPGRRAPGRGAYLHLDPGCWTTFVGRRGPIRSLRATPARRERERLVAALAAAAGGKVTE